MTAHHRKRLLFVIALVTLVLLSAASPTIAEHGILAGLGVLAVSAVPSAVLIGLVAYVWTGNDKEDRERG